VLLFQLSRNLLIPHGFEPNYTVGFARGLHANGVRFLVVSDDEISPRLDAIGITHVNLRGSLDPRRPLRQKLPNLLRYYFRLFSLTFKYRGATVHFTGLLNKRILLLEGLILPSWFRLCAGRYVHTAHNAVPHGREDSAAFRFAYRWIYRFPHTIVVHTTQLAKQLESEFGVEHSRISIISIGLNEEVPEIRLTANESRRKLELPTRGAIALFFGKVEPYKGVDVLVEAWSLMKSKDAHLAIVGECSDCSYASVIRSILAKSPRVAEMEWREGFISNTDVALWLKACDVVVMPYRNIYQSGVLFLSFRFGVPIVATDVGALSEFVDAESGVIASSNDPAGIAGALDCFFAAPAQFSRDNIARRATKYAWDKQCAKIKHLYS
jgi:glycosyltransferase involved in cell wall biosynthesis